jgi:hypothetical protein
MSLRTLITSLLFLNVFNVIGQDTLNLRFIDATNVYNNHVGNEWAVGTFIDENLLNLGDAINIIYDSLDDSFELVAVLQEGREIHNDSNSKEFVMTFRELFNNYRKGFNIEIDLREGHGRYAGNLALWKFHYELKFKSKL